MPDILLARHADAIFWLGRYIERAENLLRILAVNDIFARDRAGGHDWRPIVRINSDNDRFEAKHGRATAENVLDFYVVDSDNPTSIVNSIRYARDNARSLRPIISTEMWVQLNMLHARVAAITPSDMAPSNRSRLFDELRRACQLYAGVTEGTFYRDQSWYFHSMGAYLERADQATRLLDIKYHVLLPSPRDVGSPVDVSQWNVLLRSASGYHAFQRLQSGQLTPGGVVSFLLLDTRFPRSVYLCVRELERLLTEMKSSYGLRGANMAAQELDGMRAALGSLTVTDILAAGLHEFLDLLQRQLVAITRDLSHSFFGFAKAA